MMMRDIGSRHSFDEAQGKSISLDNIYQDNLARNGGWGETHVSLGDPVAQSANGDPTGSIEDYDGWAAFTEEDAKTVRAQGYTDQLNAQITAKAFYNKLAVDSYSAGDWENYFISEASSASPWTVSVDTGHQVRGDDTIQNAITTMPYADGNIYLLPSTSKVYYENNIVNYAAADKSFDLLALTGDRTFTFKNIDFRNSNSATTGGAIMITAPVGFTATANIENCAFDSNDAGQDAGAVGNALGALNIEASTFNDNNAQGVATIENCGFTDNHARVSGAVANGDSMNLGPNGGSMTLNGCTFDSNSATLYGGAYAAWNGILGPNTAGTVNTITNSDFMNNVANGGLGAAIFVMGKSDNTIEDNTYTGNLPAGHNVDM